MAKNGYGEPAFLLGLAGIVAVGIYVSRRRTQPQVSATHPIYVDNETVTSGSAPSAMVRQIQTILRDMGYNPGPIDGVMGGATRQAASQFLSDRPSLAAQIAALPADQRMTRGQEIVGQAILARTQRG